MGSEELIEQILKGTIDFDRCIATPEMMPKLGKVARVRRNPAPSAPLAHRAQERSPVRPCALLGAPDGRPLLYPWGQILGPRGMMPNPKLGSVTKDVTKGVKELKAGQVQFRTEKRGIVHAGVGKVSFTAEALLENVRAFMVALANCKPESQKGKFIKAAHMTSTMGPGFKIDVSSIDPASPRFMI